MDVRYRDQTLENERIKSENQDLKKRNDYLESKSVRMLKLMNYWKSMLILNLKLLKKDKSLKHGLNLVRQLKIFWKVAARDQKV